MSQPYGAGAGVPPSGYGSLVSAGGYGPAPGAPYGPPRPRTPLPLKPGCIPLRPLGVGDILDGSFTAIRRNPRVMLGLSAVISVVQALVVLGVQALTFRELGRVKVTDAAGAGGSTGLGPLVGTESGQLVTVLISALFGAVLTGLLTTAIAQDALGVRLDLGQVWERSRRKLPALIGLSLLLTIAQTVGLVLCLAPGVWLWGLWAVAAPAMMVEQTSIGGAFRRSQQLVKNSFWRVWGIRALGYLVALIVSAFLAAPFLLVGVAVDNDVFHAHAGTNTLPVAFLLLSAAGSIVATTFVAPLRAGVDALLYLDLRMRKEGLDIVLRLNAATAPPVGHA